MLWVCVNLDERLGNNVNMKYLLFSWIVAYRFPVMYLLLRDTKTTVCLISEKSTPSNYHSNITMHILMKSIFFIEKKLMKSETFENFNFREYISNDMQIISKYNFHNCSVPNGISQNPSTLLFRKIFLVAQMLNIFHWK